MRLRRLQLRRYGCFDDVDLEFATEPGRVTMVVAPNGAGKSVLRRAFHDLLFDIPAQSPMKFRHGYPGMALHAEAIDAAGAGFGFGWVRNGKPPRVTTDQERFAALQRGVTPQQLERLFALDTGGLRKGGTDLKGGTTLAGALLAGTGELAPAKSVRAVIEARRQANWGQGKSKPPLNAAASKLDAERKRARVAVQRPEKREREERDLDELRRRHAAAKRKRDDALAETRRLNRVALTRPHLQSLAGVEEWLAANPDAPALPPGLDRELAEARGAVATAQATRDEAERALTLAIQAAGRIERDAVATGFMEPLAELQGRLGEAGKTAKDIVERRAEHAAKLDDVRSALRAIGAAVTEQEAGDVVPTLGLMAEARAAITEKAGLRKALDLAMEGVAKARTAQVEIANEPATTLTLPAGLVLLLREIRADRKPTQHAAEVAEKAQTTASKVRAALALMPGWAGTADALRALAPPSEAAFERLDAARQAAAGRHEKVHEHRAGLLAQQAAARKSLAALRQRSLPDTAAIAAARTERDRGMRLVLRRAFAEPPSLTEEAGYGGGEPVGLVYERQVRSADELADRREAELERVQEAERVGRLLADLDGPLREAGEDEVESARDLGTAERTWADAIAQLGLDPAARMAELRKALAGRLALIEAMADAEVAAGAETALKALHHGWAVRLAALLGVPTEALGALLSRADGLVVAAGEAEAAGIKHRAALDAAQRGLREAADALAKAEHALEEWREGWAGLLDRLHRPAGEATEAVSAVLGGIVTLDQHHRDSMSLERRVDAMQEDLERFASGVTELARSLGEPAAPTPADTARALVARAASASAAESAWNQAQLGLEQARKAVADGEAGLSDARIRLAAVIAACGGATAEDAEIRIAASRAHSEQMARRNAARDGLAEHGDGLSDGVLRAEADAIPADDMAVRRHEAEESARTAGVEAEDAAVRLAQTETALDAESDATTAVDAQADYEAAVAEFSRRLEDQLVLHVAGSMLGAAMRSVEADMGGSSLARVSQTFSAVTDGAYGLEIQDGPQGEELHAVEHAYPQERKSLDDMSEGTRDQLYLALRMVALRDHCASATALPFIADDILQTFDDVRAGATLRALGDLSNELQVIVLTHHPHLEQVAAELGEGRVHLLRL